MIYYLIGMMGSGKTTTGELLAKRLGIPWVDLDQWMAKEFKMSTGDYIRTYGIEAFRRQETLALFHHRKDQQVISCGGGIILKEENVTYMKEHGTIIYLQLSIDALVHRLSQTDLKERPLLNVDLRQTVATIASERISRYEQAADITIDCDGLAKDEVVDQIMNRVSLHSIH